MIVTMTTSISLHVKDEKEHFHGTRREIKFWEQDVSSISIRNFSFPNGHVMLCLLYMDVDGTSTFHGIYVLGFYSFSMR